NPPPVRSGPASAAQYVRIASQPHPTAAVSSMPPGVITLAGEHLTAGNPVARVRLVPSVVPHLPLDHLGLLGQCRISNTELYFNDSNAYHRSAVPRSALLPVIRTGTRREHLWIGRRCCSPSIDRTHRVRSFCGRRALSP